MPENFDGKTFEPVDRGSFRKSLVELSLQKFYFYDHATTKVKQPIV